MVKETAGGIVVSGTLGLGTALCYADDILVMPLAAHHHAGTRRVVQLSRQRRGRQDPGPQAIDRHEDRFSYPLSARFDELDCAVVFDNTFIPWENVFAYRDPEFCNAYMFRSFPLGVFYHLARKLGHAEFWLAWPLRWRICRASRISWGAGRHQHTHRPDGDTAHCAKGGMCRCEATGHGDRRARPDAYHHGQHLCPQQSRQDGETVRNLAGYGCMLSPALNDLLDPDFGPAIVPNYEGGGYTARERAALLHLLNDATALALEGGKRRLRRSPPAAYTSGNCGLP